MMRRQISEYITCKSHSRSVLPSSVLGRAEASAYLQVNSGGQARVETSGQSGSLIFVVILYLPFSGGIFLLVFVLGVLLRGGAWRNN